MYRGIRLVLFFIAMATLLTTISSEIFTSTSKVEMMVLEEDQLLTHLKKYLDMQYDSLKAMSNFYADRIRDVSTRPRSENVDGQLKHPNDVFLIIGQFATDYSKSLGHHFDKFYKMVTTNTSQHLANIDDVQGAIQAMLRLQSVYNLTAMDMANGDYLGHQGSKLSYQDAYKIGQAAFTGYQLNQSLDWLKTSYSLMKNSTTLEEGPTEAAIRGLIGRVCLYMGKLKSARSQYNISKSLDPEEDEVISLGEELEFPPLHSVREFDEEFQNYSRLCSIQHRLVPADSNDPRIACRYREAVLPYYRFKEEILSLSPFASVFYNIVSDGESQHLKDKVKDQLVRAEVVLPGAKHGVSHGRTGDLSWIMDADSSIASSISKRLECITRLNLSQGLSREFYAGEPYQVLNYGLGGHYEIHLDSFKGYPSKVLDPSGNRLATVLIYLSDVEKGGSTVFTKAGIAVPPIKNMALMWYNHHPSMKSDEDTLHGGCPVVIGHKWIANKWIWSNGNTFHRRCGLTRNAKQLDIEQDMIRGYK